MSSGRVKVEGLAGVEAALAALGKSAGRRVLRRIAIARLEPVAEAMRQGAPVDDSDLRDSIAVSTKRPRRHFKRDAVEAHAGPGQNPQAHLQEFGTQHHGPQPFARPAWDQEKGNLLPGLAEELWADIQKTAQRAAKRARSKAAKG